MLSFADGFTRSVVSRLAQRPGPQVWQPIPVRAGRWNRGQPYRKQVQAPGRARGGKSGITASAGASLWSVREGFPGSLPED